MKSVNTLVFGVLAAATLAAGHALGALASNELQIGGKTGKTVKPLNGVGGGPKFGWGVGKDGGVYCDATHLYRKIAPPFVRFHDIETPFGRGQFFDLHIYTNDVTTGHARYFEKSDAYVDAVLAGSPDAKIIFRIGESIGASDDNNPYGVRPVDYNAWCTAAVEIAEHYVKKYPRTEWFFEIWNEPNLTGDGCHGTFSSAPSSGDTCPAEDYFALYEKAALALGELRKRGGYRNMKIGGPTVSGIEKGNWSTFSCEEFIAELERYNAEHKCVVPLDFYSWHQYDGPVAVTWAANHAGEVLAASRHYRKTLNICDEWNLSVQQDRVGNIGLAEGTANTLATMIAWQDSALDAATYYDSQLTGSYNGLWYKPYFEAMMNNQQAFMEMVSVYNGNGIEAITPVQRRYLGDNADSAPIVLGGYWAMRTFTTLASHGEQLRIERGSSVPSTVYALASRSESGGAFAIVNNSSTATSVRVTGIPFSAPVYMSRVTGASTAGQEVKPTVSTASVSGGALNLSLGAWEFVLLCTGEGLK